MQSSHLDRVMQQMWELASGSRSLCCSWRPGLNARAASAEQRLPDVASPLRAAWSRPCHGGCSGMSLLNQSSGCRLGWPGDSCEMKPAEVCIASSSHERNTVHLLAKTALSRGSSLEAALKNMKVGSNHLLMISTLIFSHCVFLTMVCFVS